MKNDWPKPVRRKITRAHEPKMEHGLWTRHVELSCGHTQCISASTYSRVPKTTVCHACSRLNDGQILPGTQP